MQMYKKFDMVGIRQMGTVKKEMAHNRYHGKTDRLRNITEQSVGIIVNRQVKVKIINKRLNVCHEPIRHSEEQREPPEGHEGKQPGKRGQKEVCGLN